MADVDAITGVDLKIKLIHALLQINSMEHHIYELEGEVDQMGCIMQQLTDLVTTQGEIGHGTIQDLDRVKGHLGMLSVSGKMRYSRSLSALASPSPPALASLQTLRSSSLVPLKEITPHVIEEAHCPLLTKYSPQHVPDNTNPGADIIQAGQINAVPIFAAPSTPSVVLILPTPQMSQEVAAYGAVPLVSMPCPQDTADEDANADTDVQMANDATDATGETEVILSGTAGKVHATTNILLASFCTHANIRFSG